MSDSIVVGNVVLEWGQVQVLRRRHAAEADAVRDAAPDVAWMVVELYRPEVDVGHARDPLLSLNVSKVDPRMAARAIDQPDLVIWYEIINPVRVTTVDGRPAADDYGNIAITVPDGSRMMAHATKEGGTAPECLQGAERRLADSLRSRGRSEPLRPVTQL